MTADASPRCPACGRPARPEARYCAACGQALEAPGAPAPARRGKRRPWRGALVASVAALLAAAIVLVFLDARRGRENEGEALRGLRVEVASLRRQAGELERGLEAVRSRLAALQRRGRADEALAARVLRSVFTVETASGEGAAFAAWRKEKDTLLLTAAHVVAGVDEVAVRQKGRSWTGRVEKVDEVNDLASVRVPGAIAPPLWQKPQGFLPQVGETLVLFGSPLGYEGSVSRGVVSRVSYRRIQTDAPATFGSSGGPALTEDGRLVGVLTSGYLGADINFVVPIRRACVEVRACPL